jgi:hypothetical protein
MNFQGGVKKLRRRSQEIDAAQDHCCCLDHRVRKAETALNRRREISKQV